MKKVARPFIFGLLLVALGPVNILGAEPGPKPVTMILLGFALIVLAGFSRERLLKK